MRGRTAALSWYGSFIVIVITFINSINREFCPLRGRGESRAVLLRRWQAPRRRRSSGDARHVSDQLSVASSSPSTRGWYTEALVSKYYTPGSPAAAFMPVASDPGWRKVSAGPTVGKLAESDRWVGLERFPTVPWCGPEYSRSP